MKVPNVRRPLRLAALAVAVLLLAGCSLFRTTPVPTITNHARGKTYTIEPGQGIGSDTEHAAYNELYDDLEGKKLTDGIVGAGYLDGNYVGFRWRDFDENDQYINHDVTITLDLEEVVEIEKVRSHWSWDLTANIRFPEPWLISYSTDGTTWSTPIEVPSKNPVGDETAPPTWFEGELKQSARYVRLQWTAKDHWYHISEVEVLSPPQTD